MRIPTLVTVPRDGRTRTGFLVAFPWARSQTCQSLLRGSGEAEGDRDVRVDVVCVGTEREAMPPRWFGAALDAQGDLD